MCTCSRFVYHTCSEKYRKRKKNESVLLLPTRDMDGLPLDVLGLVMQHVEPCGVVVLANCVSKRFASIMKRLNWMNLVKYHFPDWWQRNYLKYQRHQHLSIASADVLIYEKCRLNHVDKRNFLLAFYLLTKCKWNDQYGMPDFGVCDSAQQLAEKYPLYIGNVYLTRVEKETNPHWRPHKDGQYVGELGLETITRFKEANGRKGRPLIDVVFKFRRGEQEELFFTIWFDDEKHFLYRGVVEK